jgi:hypothetical protein
LGHLRRGLDVGEDLQALRSSPGLRYVDLLRRTVYRASAVRARVRPACTLADGSEDYRVVVAALPDVFREER